MAVPNRNATKATLAAIPHIPKDLTFQFLPGLTSSESVVAISLAFKKALSECTLCPPSRP